MLLLAAVFIFISSSAFAAPDRYVLITLLHTNDMHATVMPENGSSGLAKIATMAKRVRAEMPNVVFLDGGDIIHGSFEDYLYGGKAVISSMNAAGYEVATFGNHEFDFGLDTTRDTIHTAVFPFISANIKDRATGGQWNGLPPYIIKTIDGVRIAVFGLATLQTVDLEWPSRIAEVKFEDPIAEAKALVPELHKQADVVVALSHLGYGMDQQLARQVEGIDFIIGGHSHTVIDKWTWVGNTMITQAGAMAAFLGRIDFIVKVGDTGVSIASVNGKNGLVWSKPGRTPLDKDYPQSPLIPVTADIHDDPAVVAAYMPYRQKARMVLDEVIGQTPEGVTGTVGDESPAANLVADSIRTVMGSDVAAVDPASVSGALTPGPITVQSAFSLIGGYTRQHLVKVEMTGAALKDLLEFYLTKKKTPALVVSGMTLSYQNGASSAPRITAINISGSPFDPSKVYTAASQAYVVMDWMEKHPEIKVVSEPKTTTREAIVDFIRANKTINYKPEGRVVKVK
jgi:2',3'-cyclic-nucleotide 2'-phosphodiesterase (5'-nucleotidase family)